MPDATDIEALVARGKSTFEGVPRDGLAWELAAALERQQAVAAEARTGLQVIADYHIEIGCEVGAAITLQAMAEGTLAALDASLEEKG